MFKIFTSAAAVLILSYPFASLPVYAESFNGSPAAVSENVTEDVTEYMTEDETEKTENEPEVKDDESESSVDKPEAKDDESESKDNESESTEKIKLCFIGAKYPNTSYDLRLPPGSALSAEKLSAWKAYGCDSSYEHEYIFDVLWDVDSFNESLQPDSRCYTITGTPVIPEDLYEIPDDITREPLRLNIFVTPDEGVDLRAYHTDFIGRIKCIWTYVIQDMTSAQLQYKAEGDAEWSTAEAETLIGDQRAYGMADLYRMSSYGEIYNCLVIYPDRLPEDAENYTFRLIYDGDRESTAITVSRSGSVQIPEIGGDRDGGDAGGGSTGGNGSGSSPDGSSSSGSHSHGSGSFESSLPAESVTSEETRIAAERLAVLLKKGKTVLYQTAPVLLESVIDFKMNRQKNINTDFYQSILDCDLLIIDDLGTESINSMKLSELFTILNTRILNLNNKITKTIISTNLNINDIFRNYEERIGSRIAGYYDNYYFFGDDLRFKK